MVAWGIREAADFMCVQGRLETKEGLPVLGESGPLQLDANNLAPVAVTPSGDVTQGGVSKGRLKLSEFNDPRGLIYAGTGLFLPSDPKIEPHATTTSRVRQGYLESSNTSNVTEMVNLISASRLFEANQKVLQSADERVSKLINDVANPTS